MFLLEEWWRKGKGDSSPSNSRKEGRGEKGLPKKRRSLLYPREETRAIFGGGYGVAYLSRGKPNAVSSVGGRGKGGKGGKRDGAISPSSYERKKNPPPRSERGRKEPAEDLIRARNSYLEGKKKKNKPKELHLLEKGKVSFLWEKGKEL